MTKTSNGLGNNSEFTQLNKAKRMLIDSLEMDRNPIKTDSNEMVKLQQIESVALPVSDNITNCIKDETATPLPQLTGQTGENQHLEFLRQENTRLTAALTQSRANCNLLEEELGKLELQTLGAIAEAGRLRREIESIRATKTIDSDDLLHERDELRNRVVQAGATQHILTEALHKSETEIATLVKSLDRALRCIQGNV